MAAPRSHKLAGLNPCAPEFIPTLSAYLIKAYRVGIHPFQYYYLPQPLPVVLSGIAPAYPTQENETQEGNCRRDARPRRHKRTSRRYVQAFSKIETSMQLLEIDRHNTTAMIKNIPSKYTREMLIQFLDDHCLLENSKDSDQTDDISAFDFVYLPVDFSTGCNKGYAFVNFTSTRAVSKFRTACHDQRWERFRSTKIRQIAAAKIQGKEALVRHFSGSRFFCGSEEFLPACFSPPRDGSGKTVRQMIVGGLVRAGSSGSG